jgi:hypothetical protein
LYTRAGKHQFTRDDTGLHNIIVAVLTPLVATFILPVLPTVGSVVVQDIIQEGCSQPLTSAASGTYSTITIVYY